MFQEHVWFWEKGLNARTLEMMIPIYHDICGRGMKATLPAYARSLNLASTPGSPEGRTRYHAGRLEPWRKAGLDTDWLVRHEPVLLSPHARAFSPRARAAGPPESVLNCEGNPG